MDIITADNRENVIFISKIMKIFEKIIKNVFFKLSFREFSKISIFSFEISTFHSQIYPKLAKITHFRTKMIFFETYSKMKFLLTWENVMRVDIFWCQFLDYFEVKNCTLSKFSKSAFFKLSILPYNLDNITKKGYVLVIFDQTSQFFRSWKLILAPIFYKSLSKVTLVMIYYISFLLNLPSVPSLLVSSKSFGFHVFHVHFAFFKIDQNVRFKSVRFKNIRFKNVRFKNDRFKKCSLQKMFVSKMFALKMFVSKMFALKMFASKMFVSKVFASKCSL